MAVAHVLEIVELLEWILLDLPIPELSRAKHVCRQFKNTIEGSKQIRRRLFLESTNIYDYRADDALPTFVYDTEGPGRLTMPFILNPMAKPYVHKLRSLARAPRGAWQRTLVSQPAMTSLRVAIDLDGGGGVSLGQEPTYRYVENEKGITIKDVVNWLKGFGPDGALPLLTLKLDVILG